MNKPYLQCYIEERDGLWWVLFPDGSKAWDVGYKRKGRAAHTLKGLIAVDNALRPFYKQGCEQLEQEKH